MSSSSSYGARRGGSGGSRQRQFPVGRWRHVAVVDAGCGCRPRRATTRLLNQLPSFLRPSANKSHRNQPPAAAPVGRSSSRSSSGFFPSSASTASSASAATFTTTHSSYSAYDYNCHSQKQQQQEDPTVAPSSRPKVTNTTMTSRSGSSASRKRQAGRKKKRYEKMGAAAAENGDDVGVAVEKESSDPRADFRDSMTQMVVEMGLCGWDDLRCMLRRLLALNAPRHHAAILAAFAEVCAQLTAPPPPQPAAYPYQYHAYDDYHYQY